MIDSPMDARLCLRTIAAAVVVWAIWTGSVEAVEPSVAAEGGGAAEPTEWLLQVSAAGHHANYQGVMVYRDDDRFETLRIVHRNKSGREQERLTALTGPALDIFREDGRVTCVVPYGRTYPALGNPRGLFPVLSRDTLERVAAHYAMRDLGEARVAGRACRGVLIQPRDEFRYGYEVCADTITAVPLRLSLLDQTGRVIEQLMFTAVTFPASIADEELVLTSGTAGHCPEPHASEPAPADVQRPVAWALDRMPPGFRVTLRDLRPLLEGESAVEHVVLSDGLSTVSVFSARARLPEKMFRGYSQMGGMHAYGRMLGSVHVTVMGEVPPTTVQWIADGLKPAGAETSVIEGQAP